MREPTRNAFFYINFNLFCDLSQFSIVFFGILQMFEWGFLYL